MIIQFVVEIVGSAVLLSALGMGLFAIGRGLYNAWWKRRRR